MTLPSNRVDGLRARAVLRPDDEEKLSHVCVTDERTALARGLREHLEDQTLIWEGGRPLRFQAVREVWAEPEMPAHFPAAAVVGLTDATYEASSFAPRLVQVADGSGVYLRQVAELGQLFQLVLWSTDPVERMGLVKMVQNALCPAEFMYGLRLELPYLFGARATYEPLNLNYADVAADAVRRWRIATITVQANVPEYVPVGALTRMQPRPIVEMGD